MRYIPAKHKLARIWVETCVRSLSMEKAEACELYARLCGFKTWSHMMLLIGNVPGSLVDEVIEESILEKRREFYVEVLCSEYKFIPRLANYISNFFSPSSGNIPKRLSVDISNLYKEDESYVHVENRLTSTFSLSESLSGRIVRTKEVSLASIRSSRPVCPSNWYVLASHLGWDVMDDSCAVDYASGEPSFWLWTAEKHRVPVFILPFTRLPEDEGDVLATAALLDIESRIAGFGVRQAIVFWGSMLIKHISGLDYTYPGVVYRDGQWRNFLLNEKMTQVQDVFDFLDYVESVDSPHPAYADSNRSLAVSFFMMCEGIESPSEVNLFVTSSGSGWGGLMSVKKI